MLSVMKIAGVDIIEQLEDLCEKVIKTIETSDLQNLEAGVWNVLEAGLFGVTALQPNIWFAFLIVMQVMILSFEGADLIFDAYFLFACPGFGVGLKDPVLPGAIHGGGGREADVEHHLPDVEDIRRGVPRPGVARAGQHP